MLKLKYFNNVDFVYKYIAYYDNHLLLYNLKYSLTNLGVEQSRFCV